MNPHRNLHNSILEDLNKKFVFLSGPRQVGKTTLAKRLIKEQKGIYLLYDDPDDRTCILKRQYLNESYVCLDEFHKFPRWKNHLKGVYDKYHETLHVLLTGSARLDVYQKSGDSLFGRYYLHHLHPLTCGELVSSSIPSLPENYLDPLSSNSALTNLLKFGGFPEPFYHASEKEHRRWSSMRNQLLIREDLRDLTKIELFNLTEQLLLLLPHRIGSVLSYRSLAEDIRVSAPTIQNWLSLFEKLFIVFKIKPYTTNITRSLQKQPKYFLYDWSQIPNEGIRFENLVASHLWKSIQVWTDLGMAKLDLTYIRDRDGREVDFLLLKENKPWFLVECKLAETTFSDHLYFFSRKLNIPGVQLVLKKKVYRREGQLALMSADQWLDYLV